MDGVGRDVCIAALEVGVDYDQVVDVVQMIPDLISGNLSCNASHNKVSGRSAGNLVRYMRWHVKLSIAPTAFELSFLAYHMACLEAYLTLFVCRYMSLRLA